MKLKELKPILQSHTGYIQWAIVYDCKTNKDIEYGCSIDYAIKNYGELKVERIQSYMENNQDYIVISVEKEN